MDDNIKEHIGGRREMQKTIFIQFDYLDGNEAMATELYEYSVQMFIYDRFRSNVSMCAVALQLCFFF
jgi:hypothetical protein